MTLSDIQQSFYTRSFNPEVIGDWLIGISLIIAALVVFLGIRAIRARRIRYSPHGIITDPQMIRNIIRTAFDQRRPFEVQVASQTGQRRPTLRCAPEYLAQTNLTLEINGLKSLSNRWLGRSVHVFFRISLHKEFTYYTFSSTIDGIFLPRQGVCHITLTMPQRLENRQKRSFLRMTPPPEFLMGAALWYGETLPQPQSMDDISLWPAPKQLFIPDKARQFEILDLSAGGVRLGVPARILYKNALQFKVSEVCVLLIDLFDPEHSKRLRFWLQCRIQNVWIEHPSGDARLGMQFRSWGRPRDGQEHGENAGGIEWLRLSASNEVEPLGNWIMRRHLEIFREHPADGSKQA
ncbi:hypothetical protein LJC59_01675 [Desulfovibrio sp. OttesenSCG-928-A18]|nr:hypothetical protein [Desulfovibrio sp. OttesenSCG-928-A18]